MDQDILIMGARRSVEQRIWAVSKIGDIVPAGNLLIKISSVDDVTNQVGVSYSAANGSPGAPVTLSI